MSRKGKLSSPVRSLYDAQELQAIGHPVRVLLLEVLREPMSAAAAARKIGHPRQKVNYHLKELERAGLVDRVGERRTGNFVESLYRAVAKSFVVSPEIAWGNPKRVEAMRSQHALESLVVLGDRLQRDAAALLDRAAFDGEQIPSAAVTVETRFASERQRAAFVEDYMRAVRRLTDKYTTKAGEPYRIVLAVYPHADEGSDE